MPHDIIDNRDLQFADAARPLLSQSVRGHVAVGYFFLRGFKAIAKAASGGRTLLTTSDRAPEVWAGNADDTRSPARNARVDGGDRGRRCRRRLPARQLATTGGWRMTSSQVSTYQAHHPPPASIL